MKKCFLFSITFIIGLKVGATGLPQFRIDIDTAHLARMNAYPDSETYFPAVFHYDTLTYTCEARYRGNTSLAYPKKSWGIKFEDANNVFNTDRIDLGADYKDYSLMRNFLILRLFKYLGHLAPEVSHVNFEVNGKNFGVFTRLEHIDAYLLTHNGRTPVGLYKAQNHGAGGYATVHDEHYSVIWDVRVGNNDFTGLEKLVNKMQYWSKADFDANIANEIETDNMLNFFAIQFVFCSMDNFTKNLNLNINSNTGKYEIIPWDNEGSFGNRALGFYDSTLITYKLDRGLTPEYNIIFQRLLENTTYRAAFIGKVNNVLTSGMSYLDTLITNTYNNIKADMYLDNNKECSNAQFDAEVVKLKNFMSARKTFLQSNAISFRSGLSNFYCSNPFPVAADHMITFRVTSAIPQTVKLHYADSVSFNAFGAPYLSEELELFDDGQHNDLLAGDLVYGGTVDAYYFHTDVVPYCFSANGFNFPANGLFYVDYLRSKTFAMNNGNWYEGKPGARTQFGRFFKQGNDIFIEVINTSAINYSDLSYCHLQAKKYYEDLMLPEFTVLAAGDTLIVSSNPALAANIFPGKPIAQNRIYFDIAKGDTLQLLAPDLSSMLSKPVTQVDTLKQQAQFANIVINEINYNDTAIKASGDWLELYNPDTAAADISGWMIRDDNETHIYTLPAGTVIPSNGYLVICEDTASFRQYNPTVTNFTGPLSFGLGNSGDMVRLYNSTGAIADSVQYDDNLPWPLEADGRGPTLELRNYQYDNALAANWYAFTGDYGTPGLKNHITNVSVKQVSSNRDPLIYPNPVQQDFTINFAGRPAGNVSITLCNVLGQQVYYTQAEGQQQVKVHLPALGAGVYILHVQSVAYSGSQRISIR